MSHFEPKSCEISGSLNAFMTIIFLHFFLQNDPLFTVDGQSCFFVDGAPLCGREGELAREKHRKMIESLIAQQVNKQLSN